MARADDEPSLVTDRGIYAEPKRVTELEDCYFYHSMDLPGHGTVEGDWDLRGGVDGYLGGVDVRGKRVLEIGTASGFLGFEMEKRGAEVVSVDLSPEDRMDVVPLPGLNVEAVTRAEQERVRRLNNAFWLAHRALGSRNRLVHATAYDVPEAVGDVDIVTYGSILLHLRDPFGAMRSSAGLARHALVVTEPFQRRFFPFQLTSRLTGPTMLFKPRPTGPSDTWWALTPGVVRAFMAVLGFGTARIGYHVQRHGGRRHPMFTVVGERTHRLHR